MIAESPIKKCLQLIEERLKWGPSPDWTNYDFEKLSSAIEDKTGVLLSITTLKRIWGKVKYDHSPTLTTLNTLARFLEHEDWRAFTQNTTCKDKQPIPEYRNEAGIENKPARRRKKLNPIVVVFSFFVLLSAISIMYFSARKDTSPPKSVDFSIVKAPDSSRFQFKADKIVGEGVPNSVIFTYDATAATTDSVYIVQTWDIRRKTLVPKYKTKHSAIYYYPGYFRTRLIVDGETVKSHNLQITSNGWLCLVENDPVPIYFKKEESHKKDRIEIDERTLASYNLSLNPVPPKIRFFNQGDLGDLMNDNFIFETTLKNEFSGGANACQYVEVLIQCKNDIIIIPLAAKACAGDMDLYACGMELKSKEADLSGFGADLNHWTTLRVETKEKKMSFFVNNVLATSFVFPRDPTGIVGVQYRFNGVGAVRNTWFENKSGRIVLK